MPLMPILDPLVFYPPEVGTTLSGLIRSTNLSFLFQSFLGTFFDFNFFVNGILITLELEIGIFGPPEFCIPLR